MRVVQAAQDAAQRWVVAGVLRSEGPYELPLAVRFGLTATWSTLNRRVLRRA